MLPSTPHATATTKLISPLAARYPAGGMTSSLGRGRIDDSTAMRTTMPGYPAPRNRSSNHAMNDSSIESMLSEQGDEPRGAERGVTHLQRGARAYALDQGQGLRAARPQRDQEAAVGDELLDQRRRYLRPAGRDQYRVVRRVRTPSQRAVAQQHRDVGNAGLAQRPLRRERESLHALDGEDGVGHGPE